MDSGNLFTLSLDVAATKTLISSQLDSIFSDLSNSGRWKIIAQLDTNATLSKIQSQLNSIKDPNFKINLDTAQIQSETNKLFSQIKSGGSSSVTGLNNISKAFQSVGSAASSSGKQSSGFFSNLKSGIGTALTNMVNYRLAWEIVNKSIEGVKDMIKSVEDLDSVLMNFNKVAKLSETGLQDFTQQAYTAAEDVGRTGSGLIEAAGEFRRAGYDLDESLDLGKAALMTTNISDKINDTSDAASRLIAVLKGFQMKESDVMSVLDSINEVANNSPIGFKDITDGLQKVSGTMHQAGVSLSETIGLLTGGFSQLRDINKVSTGLITISSRLRGVDEDGSILEGINSDNLKAELEEAFGSIGVSITDQAGELRSVYDVVRDYAAVYDQLDSKQRQYFGELAAGKRQITVWNAMVQQIQDVDTAVEQAENSTGSAAESNEIYKQSVEGLKQEFQNAFQELSQATIDSDWVKDLISAGTALLKTLKNIVSEDSLVHDSISLITGAIKGLSSVLEVVTGNKGIAGLISSFVTLKAVTSGFNLFGGKGKNELGKIIIFRSGAKMPVKPSHLK